MSLCRSGDPGLSRYVVNDLTTRYYSTRSLVTIVVKRKKELRSYFDNSDSRDSVSIWINGMWKHKYKQISSHSIEPGDNSTVWNFSKSCMTVLSLIQLKCIKLLKSPFVLREISWSLLHPFVRRTNPFSVVTYKRYLISVDRLSCYTSCNFSCHRCWQWRRVTELHKRKLVSTRSIVEAH